MVAVPGEPLELMAPRLQSPSLGSCSLLPPLIFFFFKKKEERKIVGEAEGTGDRTQGETKVVSWGGSSSVALLGCLPRVGG